MFRTLTDDERALLSAFAAQMDSADGRLLDDISRAEAESTMSDDSQLKFRISGYEPFPYRGQHSYPVEAAVLDADGALVHLVLYADEHGHLYELVMFRPAGGALLGPRWSTVSFHRRSGQ
jgi:hypothetical protein